MFETLLILGCIALLRPAFESTLFIYSFASAVVSDAITILRRLF